MNTGMDLLKRLLLSRGLDETWIPEVVRSMIAYGGIDTEDLNEESVLQGLSRAPNAPWRELIESCGCLLHLYWQETSQPDDLVVLGAVGAIAIVSFGIQSKFGTGWELANICKVLYVLREPLYEDLEVVFIFVANQLNSPESVL